MKIGIDLGGSHIGVGLVNEEGIILKKQETDLKGKENIEDFIKTYILESIQKLMGNNTIDAIGVASPGAPKDGKITNIVNLGIKQLDIAKIIQTNYNLPVKVENDAKCAGMAEKKYGSLKEYEDAVFICLGTGIGGCAFVGGERIKPVRNPGIEIGHMIIDKNGNLCNCGKRGCFETYCSMKRLKNKLIQELELPKTISAIELLSILKIRKKEEKVQAILEEYTDNLLVGLSNVIDIFEPQAICLGGSFVYFEEILYELLIEKYYEKRYVFNKDKMPDLKLALLGNDAGIIGATILQF